MSKYARDAAVLLLLLVATSSRPLPPAAAPAFHAELGMGGGVPDHHRG